MELRDLEPERHGAKAPKAKPEPGAATLAPTRLEWASAVGNRAVQSVARATIQRQEEEEAPAEADAGGGGGEAAAETAEEPAAEEEAAG